MHGSDGVLCTLLACICHKGTTYSTWQTTITWWNKQRNTHAHMQNQTLIYSIIHWPIHSPSHVLQLSLTCFNSTGQTQSLLWASNFKKFVKWALCVMLLAVKEDILTTDAWNYIKWTVGGFRRYAQIQVRVVSGWSARERVTVNQQSVEWITFALAVWFPQNCALLYCAKWREHHPNIIFGTFAWQHSQEELAFFNCKQHNDHLCS